MSKIPDTKKTRYNKNDPFRWVDSQWEKFMTEQKELKKVISQMQEDLITCNKHFQKQRDNLLKAEMENAELKDIIEELGGNDRIPGLNKTNVESIRSDEWRIEQFNRNRAPEDQVSTIEEMEERVKQLFDKKYIYESPDAGKTITRRKFGDYDNKETLNN